MSAHDDAMREVGRVAGQRVYVRQIRTQAAQLAETRRRLRLLRLVINGLGPTAIADQDPDVWGDQA